MGDWSAAQTDRKKRAMFLAHTNKFSTFRTYWRERMKYARWWVEKQRQEGEGDHELQARCDELGRGLGEESDRWEGLPIHQSWCHGPACTLERVVEYVPTISLNARTRLHKVVAALASFQTIETVLGGGEVTDSNVRHAATVKVSNHQALH